MYEAIAHHETHNASRFKTLNVPSRMDSINMSIPTTDITKTRIRKASRFSLGSFVLRSITRTAAKTGPMLTDLHLVSKVKIPSEGKWIVVPSSGHLPNDILSMAVPAGQQSRVGQNIETGNIGQDSESPCRCIDIVEGCIR